MTCDEVIGLDCDLRDHCDHEYDYIYEVADLTKRMISEHSSLCR
jgi:hypothetical protein